MLHLQPGEHNIDLRLIRDLREMGGSDCPKIEVGLKAQLSEGDLIIPKEKMILPDIIDSTLANDLASLVACNVTEEWIDVLDIESLDVRVCLSRMSL